MVAYNQPKSTGNVVKFIGEGFHVVWLETDRIFLVECDSDHWKTYAHQRLATPMFRALPGSQDKIPTPGALTLFKAPPQEFITLAKHWTAERMEEEFIAGTGPDKKSGLIKKWVKHRRANHHLDNLYNTLAAAWLCGVRLTPSIPVVTPKEPPKPAPLTMPDGRPYLVTERN